MFGCATVKYKAVPPIQKGTNEYFKSTMEPVIFLSSVDWTSVYSLRPVAFALTILNKTNKDLELDWNKTLFIQRGVTSGGFMFEGISYRDRNNPKSPDIIFANSRFWKSIYPNILVKYYNKNWYHIGMGPGKVGMVLTIRIEGKEIREKMIVDFVPLKGCAEVQPPSLDAKPYFNSGLAYSKKGQDDQAISDFSKAIEINPGYAKAYHARGHTYAIKHQYDQAISDFSKAIEINPRDAKAYFSRGLVYEEKDQHDQAISNFSKAIELNPRDAASYYTRAIAYFSKTEYDKAWDDVKKAQDLGYKIHPGFLKALREVSGEQK